MATNREIWKDIIGYEGEYQISNLGRVKSLPKYSNSKGYPQLRKEKLLKSRNTGKYKNYKQVTFRDGKSYKVHRLVAQAFIPNPNNLPCINHKDENPQNNCVDNLEWCTNQYNVKYSAKPLTDEHKNKIKAAHVGKKHAIECREKIGKAIRDYYAKSENRQKQSDVMKTWWKNRKEQVSVNESWKAV